MKLGLALGVLFGPVAGLMAFLITYQEYRHHYSSPGPARREALRAGLFATAVFLALLSLAGLVVDRALGTPP